MVVNTNDLIKEIGFNFVTTLFLRLVVSVSELNNFSTGNFEIDWKMFEKNHFYNKNVGFCFFIYLCNLYKF